jgi:hypothetical protein
MARTAIPTSTTNDLITAAWFNTYLRDNESYYYSELVAIYSGRVNGANGAAIKLPSGWSSSREQEGEYKITHNLGNTNYTVVVMSHPKFPTTYTIASNYFVVRTYAWFVATTTFERDDCTAVHFMLIKD